MEAKLICLLLLAGSTTAVAQSSDTYQKAAQVYENAASQCQSPTGASCMRQNASYYSCLAHQLQGGGGCIAPPSCSTSCSSPGSGSGASTLGTAASGLNQKQQLAITGISLALTWLSNHHRDDAAAPQTAEDEAATAAQREAHEAAVEAAIAQADQASSELADLRTAITSGADPSTLGGMYGQGPIDPMVALRNQLTAGGPVPRAGNAVDPGVTPVGDGTMNVQYENLDHPGVASEIDYGKPQEALPLYKWTPEGADPSNSYCQAQPNVPCEQVPNAAGPRDQFSTPPNVTSPASSSDCDALDANWQQTTSAISANHGACLASYQGQDRVGTGSETDTLCRFQACQEVHNSMYRAAAQRLAAVQACRQAVAGN
jgi:hypothetical protein